MRGTLTGILSLTGWIFLLKEEIRRRDVALAALLYAVTVTNEVATFVVQEFQALVDQMPLLTTFMPGMRRYLLEYPRVPIRTSPRATPSEGRDVGWSPNQSHRSKVPSDLRGLTGKAYRL